MVTKQSKNRGRPETLKMYCHKALEMGMNGAKVINPRSIITDERVRMKCQFGCPMFGRRLTCPPYTPTPATTRKVIDSYQTAILIQRKLGDKDRTENFSENEFRRKLNRTIVRLEIQLFLDGYYKALSMGSGACRLCKHCDTTSFCKHGFEARPSMEACGIDVFKTSRGNGFLIDVVRTREDEKHLLGVILVE